MGKFSVDTIFSAIDRMSRPVNRMQRGVLHSFDKMERSTKKLSRAFSGITAGMAPVAAVGAAVGGAVIAGLTSSTLAAADFEKQMANVATIIDTNVESLDTMDKKVLEIAARTPVKIEELTDALYDVRSAGISASDQFKVLEGSARLAVVGLGTTKESADIVTSAINAFALEGKAADLVYNQVFKTVRAGKTTISSLAQGFGSVAGTISATGTKFDEYLSAVAAMTSTGQPASQAHSQLKAVFAGLTRETKETSKVFAALGAKNLPDLIAKSDGFVPALQKISKELGGDQAAMLKLVGSTEALNAVIGLTGNLAGRQKDALASMRNGVDDVSIAFEKQEGTISGWQTMMNKIQKLQIKIGKKIQPIVVGITASIGKWVEANEGLIVDKIAAFIEAAKPLVKIFSDSFVETISAIGEGLAIMFPANGAKDSGEWSAALKSLAKNLGQVLAVVAVTTVGVVAALATITTGVVLAVSALWSGIKGIGQAIVTFLGNIVFKVTDWWANLGALFDAEGMSFVEKAIAIGKHIVEGLVTGIKSLASMPFDALKAIGSGALSGLKNALGIKSPSKEMAKLGAFTAEGFQMGLDKHIPKIDAVMSQMAPANDTAPDVQSVQSGNVSRLEHLFENRSTGEVVIRNESGQRAEVRNQSGPIGLRVASTGAA